MAGAAVLAGSAAMAQTVSPVPPVTPEQHFPPGYLEAVATGYDHGPSMPDSKIDKLSNGSPATAGVLPRASATTVEVAYVSSQARKKNLK